MDPPPQRQGRGAGQGAGAAQPGSRLRGDRGRAGGVEELGLTLGPGHAPPAAAQLRGMPQARSRGCSHGTGRPSDPSARPSARRCGRRRPPRSALLSDREILIAGAIAYWCEGTKSKPYRQAERVVFINSDPGLIKFFLRFLSAAGVEPAQLRFRVHIHESADVAAAEQFWLGVTARRSGAVPADHAQAAQPADHPQERGCRLPRVPASFDVRQSADLYRRIEGWVRAVTAVTPMTDRTEPPGSGLEPG